MALVLEAAVRTEILARRRYALDKRVAYRLSAVLWVADGRTGQEVADLLGITARQVRKWLRRFRTQELDALGTLGFHGDPGKLRPAPPRSSGSRRRSPPAASSPPRRSATGSGKSFG